MKSLILISLVLLGNGLVKAEQDYRVTLLRATPGSLAQLIMQTKQYKTEVNQQLTIMRHSQGDHWDLMLLEPADKNPLQHKNFGEIADFQHTFLASSKSNWAEVNRLGEQSGLFHIEMFNARHGKSNELLKQREMENHYLTSTKRRANLIFKTTFGSDVDSFTIGYYKDMLEFASMPKLAPQVFSKAATDAGFKSRDDIGLYLRALIVSHQDTLATQVE